MKKIGLHRISECIAVLLACVLGMAGGFVRASSSDDVSARVSELNRLFAKIYEEDEDSRWNACDSFTNAARQVMEDYAGEDFPFENIRNINYFKADNGEFRILN